MPCNLTPSNFEAQRDLIRYEMNAPGIVGGGDDKALKHIDDLEKIDSIEGQLARGEFFATKKKDGRGGCGLRKNIWNRIPIELEFISRSAIITATAKTAKKWARRLPPPNEIDPNDRRLKFYKGILLVLKGKNPTEAESLLKSYLATVPNHSDLPPHSAAREWLGKLYESQGRFSEAAEEYRASLDLDPHNKAVEEALKRVQRSK